jgi:hypothetical protein
MKKILPDGYYLRDEANPYRVKLQMGPYKGLKIQIGEKIKIRDNLTSSPQMMYNYKILDYSGYETLEVESSKSLSKIIGAIAVEFLSEEILGGGQIESVACPKKPGSKVSS